MKSKEIRKIISEEVNRVLEQEQGLVELSRLNEAKLRKGDIIKMQDGEYGVVNKLKGKVAYIKLKSSPGTFHPIEADRTTYKGKHKGKDLYLESLNEAREFVVIDPKGNAKPVGMKIQGAQYVKKMGGPRKGYHLVLKKNAMKARRAVEKHGATSSKTQNLMFDLMYEGPQVAPQKRMEFGVEYVDGKGKPKKDNSLIKRFKTKALADKYAKKGNKIDKVGGKYTVIQVPVQESVNEGTKLARGLKPLLTIGTKITKKVGEDALMKLSDKFDRIDDEYAGDIASHLDMAIELMQDGYPGDATKMLKQFNKKCKEVLKGKTVKSVFEQSKVNEGRPMPMDTPNEFAYTDFKKWAYQNRTAVKNILLKALKDNRDDGTYLFLALTQVWLAWARKKAKDWTGIPVTPVGKKNFGRALAVMMKKDNLVIKRAGNKLTTVEGKVNEATDLWKKLLKI